MSKKQVDFEFFAEVLSFMGLGSLKSNRKRNFVALLIFFISLPLHIIYLVILETRTTNVVDRARILQIIPLLIGISINSLNMKWKFQEIKKLLKTIKKMTKNIKSEKILNEMESEKNKIFKFFFVICIVSISGTQIFSLVQQESFMPIWTPEILAGHYTLVFVLNWTWETFRALYSSCLSLSIDFLLLFSLSSLKSIAKHISEDIGSLKSATEKRKLLKLLQQFYELKL